MPKLYTFCALVLTYVLNVPVARAVEDAKGLVTCSGGDCNFCSFVDMTNGLIDWTIIIATVLTVLLLAFAGFRLITSAGDASALEHAKKLLLNSFIGILIMLAGWTIVDTGLKMFAGGDLGVWNAVECGEAFDLAPASDFGIRLTGDNGVNFTTVDNFTGDHGDGSIEIGNSVQVGSAGNCPGASGDQVVLIPDENKRFYLRRDAAENFIRMRSAAATDGITLRLTSAWRSQATQEEIWRHHRCDVVNCSGTVARPCSKGGNGSNHNGGVAVDIVGSGRGTAIFNWLKVNGGRYGFNNNLGADDPVHWSPTGR